ncbi:hypothetical protein [Rosistilla oblonga]|uniref:hypothetical protein n=1 Tax=Rosistilla oblonga TaxID=2527990 RepID=UPI003A979B4D
MEVSPEARWVSEYHPEPKLPADKTILDGAVNRCLVFVESIFDTEAENELLNNARMAWAGRHGSLAFSQPGTPQILSETPLHLIDVDVKGGASICLLALAVEKWPDRWIPDHFDPDIANYVLAERQTLRDHWGEAVGYIRTLDRMRRKRQELARRLSFELAAMRDALQRLAFAISELAPLCVRAHRDLAQDGGPAATDWPGQTPIPLSRSACPMADYEGKYVRREVGWPKKLDNLQAALAEYWEAWTDADRKLDGIRQGSLVKLNALQPEWKTAVRAHLDGLGAWLSWTKPRNENPADLETLMRILGTNPPPKNWQADARKLYDFDNQIRALRGNQPENKRERLRDSALEAKAGPPFSGVRAYSEFIGDDQKPFPFPYGSALHWLWGWGLRVYSLWGDDTRNPASWLPQEYEPCSEASGALAELGVKLPTAIKQIQERLDFLRQAHGEPVHDEEYRSAVTRCARALSERIEQVAWSIHRIGPQNLDAIADAISSLSDPRATLFGAEETKPESLSVSFLSFSNNMENLRILVRELRASLQESLEGESIEMNAYLRLLKKLEEAQRDVGYSFIVSTWNREAAVAMVLVIDPVRFDAEKDRVYGPDKFTPLTLPRIKELLSPLNTVLRWMDARIEQVDRAIANPGLGESASDSGGPTIPDNVPLKQTAPLSGDALANSFNDATKGFSDAQWSEKFERRYKERAKQGRGKNCKSFYVDNVGGIYYGDARTFVFKCMGRRGYYSLCTSHSEKIGKTIAEKFSLYRRNGRT